MAKFRKKPVVIEAERYTGQWSVEGLTYTYDQGAYFAYIDTLEGRMLVSKGDWVITGVKNERYPCKDEIFRMTYEPANE